jgi:Fe-S-cluster containining protein
MTELETLCRACGLCCDGSLFGRVELEPDEVEPARRLNVLTHFDQPCPALATSGCTIYRDRPRSCRRFTCRLYERHRREGGPLDARLAVVRRARALLAGLDRAAPVPAELTRLLDEDFARAT